MRTSDHQSIGFNVPIAFEENEMAARMPTKDRRDQTNAYGVTAPVQPRKMAAKDSFDNRLKRVTTKHRKAIESLAKR